MFSHRQAREDLINNKINFDGLKSIFIQHSRYEQKIQEIGGELTAIKIKPAPKGYHNCYYMCGPKAEVDISLKKCCKSSTYTNIKKSETYREIIQPQITDFYIYNKHVCAMCGSYDSPQVDHIIEFKDLVTQFESQTTITDFALYHGKYAKLRILCGPCNRKRLTKGIKE